MDTELSRPAGDIPGDFDQAVRERANVEDGLPYRPSWVDRLTDWIRRLPFPAWVFYLVLGLVHALLLMATLWIIDVIPFGTFVPDYFLLGLTCAYLLALIHYLDDWAEAALSHFRPVLTVDAAEYNRLRYQLTTLPVKPALIAPGLGVIYALGLLITLFFDKTQDLGTVPLIVIVVEIGSRILLLALTGVLIYHTLHQLRMVNEIYTKHTRINLFQCGPIYALSGLTARTAIGLGIPNYLWFQLNSLSDSGNSPSDIFETILVGIVMVATFVWPLVGAPHLLEREKQRLKDEVAQRMETTIAELHSSVDTGTLTHRGALKQTLEGLVTEQGVIDKLRTWPWRIETLGGLGLAFLLPMFIWIVQRLLERLGM